MTLANAEDDWFLLCIGPGVAPHSPMLELSRDNPNRVGFLARGDDGGGKRDRAPPYVGRTTYVLNVPISLTNYLPVASNLPLNYPPPYFTHNRVDWEPSCCIVPTVFPASLHSCDTRSCSAYQLDCPACFSVSVMKSSRAASSLNSQLRASARAAITNPTISSAAAVRNSTRRLRVSAPLTPTRMATFASFKTPKVVNEPNVG